MDMSLSHRIIVTTAIITHLIIFSTGGISTAKEPVTITLQVDNRVNYVAWIHAVVESFEKEHPDINVDIWVPTGNLGEAIVVNLAAGMPLDIGLHDPHFVIDLARQGLLEDLTPFVTQGSDHFHEWYRPALEMNTYQDGLYGLPRDLQIYGVYYNADAFNASGVSFPRSDWSWDDYHDKSRRLLVIDPQGEIMRRGAVLPKWRNWIIPIWAHGGDLVNSWTDPTRFTGRTDHVIKGIKFLQEFVQTQSLNRTSDANWGEAAAFYDQRNAIFMQNTIAIQSLRDIDTFTWDVAPMPIGPAGRITAISGLSWFMVRDSRHRDEVWALLRYITSPKALTMLVEMAGVPPPHRDVVVNDWMRSLDRPESRFNILVDIDYARPSIGALPASIYNPLIEETNAIIWGDKSFSAGMEHMEQRVLTAIENLLDP